MLENEKKGEKLEKITWFLKGQGRIRIRKFITDPDPDPRGQKNTDPYGSGSGSGSETLIFKQANDCFEIKLLRPN